MFSVTISMENSVIVIYESIALISACGYIQVCGQVNVTCESIWMVLRDTYLYHREY